MGDKITLTDGSPLTPDYKDLKPNGQQHGYAVLSVEERSKGFVRPVNEFIWDNTKEEVGS